MSNWYVYGKNYETNREEFYGIYDSYERAIERIVTLYKIDEQSVVYKHKVMYWLKER